MGAKVRITYNDVDEFAQIIANDLKKLDNYDLMAFYRGGLPLGVKISNVLDKNLTGILLQTRDQIRKPLCLFTHKIESKTLVVVEDIIDSGKTIVKFLTELKKNYDIDKVYIYTLVENTDTTKNMDVLNLNFDVEVKSLIKYFPDTWYVFPWEIINANQAEPVSDLVRSMEETFSNCLHIAAKKNSDYNAGTNPLDNFMNVEKLNIATAEQGILVRLSDKLSRLISLSKPDKVQQVKDESIMDTIDDAINYMALLKEVIKYKKGQTNE